MIFTLAWSASAIMILNVVSDIAFDRQVCSRSVLVISILTSAYGEISALLVVESITVYFSLLKNVELSTYTTGETAQHFKDKIGG